MMYLVTKNWLKPLINLFESNEKFSSSSASFKDLNNKIL